MSYKMYLGINNGEEGFILPVLAEEIEITEDGNNKTFDIVKLGEVNVLNQPKLLEISFESFFPSSRGPYVSSEELFSPDFYISKIKEWRDKKQKIRFIFTGSKLEINDLFGIESFEYSEKGGEVGDIYYSLELKQYKQYSAKRVVINKQNNTQSSNQNRSSEKSKSKTHTVKKGDTLWHISKKYLGNANRYNEIAKLNNIKNPNRIYPGQVLKLP